MTAELPIQFDENGLVPAVISDSASGDVLMMAYMNKEALETTRRTGRTHFWSRSRQQLWRKGETSGHEQIVDEILINCEQNSLLIHVRQIGAACHDGYSTCYYRRLEPDGNLSIQRERLFDPAAIYGDLPNINALSREWFGAYRFLAEHNLGEVSSTSARLRDSTFDANPRIADEMRELAGVLNGTHVHGSPNEDALLEGTQVLYWLAVAAIRLGFSWDDVRPDRAFATGEEELERALLAKMLAAEADRAQHDDAAAIHAAMALVSQACQAMGTSPRQLLLADIADLKSKPYLSDYFGDLPSG
jgi:phosphoribosyl-AMP cyclohydrolase